MISFSPNAEFMLQKDDSHLRDFSCPEESASRYRLNVNELLWDKMSEVFGSNISNYWLRAIKGVNETKRDWNLSQPVTYVNYYLHQPQVAAVFIFSYFLIFSLCIVGNVMVCFIVLKNKHMYTVTNLFILNLAISDLLVGIFCMPITLLDNIIAGWPFGNPMCKISGMVQGISVVASVFTLVAIAVDRFQCVVYPFKPKLTVKMALVIVGAVWVLAVALMSPSAVMLRVQEEGLYAVRHGSGNQSSPIYWCREAWPREDMRKVYTTVLFANIYLAPLALIVVMYGRVGVALFKTGGPPRTEAVPKRKQRVVKMLLVVALLFMLSWLPLWTLMMLSDFADLSPQRLRVINLYVYPFAHWLAFCNSSINPIIFGFFNESFRLGFREVFGFWSRREKVGRREACSEGTRSPAGMTTATPMSQQEEKRLLRPGESALNEPELPMEELKKVNPGNDSQKP
ncbi:neuropeptide FF receptor 2 [Tachyglossus aculeatus]|uniref:neuropeptide FF receptor 2 n=1 Tax=Tachyglossus aculeatus TaxID=9261 RepID=UPI0018F28114|nr:neuropeptide FF receptor 2 [Tachyglossus aculeatus]